MGFCHQKDLFRIGSKPAFYLPVLKLHEKKDFFYILRKKCGELTVDNHVHLVDMVLSVERLSMH